MRPVSSLLTDLYELTMAAAYFKEGMDAQATFSLYVRRHPQRGFFVAAGLDIAMNFLAQMRFEAEEVAYLRRTGRFDNDFLRYLETFRFTGHVRAMPEGTVFFADEPIIEVTAPIIQGQLIETYLINVVGLHSMLATKAARCVHAAQGHSLIDFSLRRTQGEDAGLAMARSSCMAGFDGTSNVLAGKRFGIPVAGTMAHSFIMAFESEIDAFRAYARRFPRQTILLIDTYDTIGGAHKAVQIAKEMRHSGNDLQGVRLDSGDMNTLSRQVRQILDESGFNDVKIFASGGYDEYRIAESIAQKAAINAFGVGTKAGVSADVPYLDMVYKMVRFDRRPVRKLSSGKISLAGAKQVYRRADNSGQYYEDLLAARDDRIADAAPLLQAVMQAGRRIESPPALSDLRRSFRQNFQRLPPDYKVFNNAPAFPVHLTDRLKAMQE